jgi:hypothetical protein
MTGRRTAVMLCVLLAHAFVVYYSMIDLWLPIPDRSNPGDVIEIVTVEEPSDEEFEPPIPWTPTLPPPMPSESVPVAEAEADEGPPAGESRAPGFVDWPVERRVSARRVLEAEREAERVAKMFSGPDGTWASLTKRERSRLQKFRWKKGVTGLEYDDKGNAIYHISEGCVVVNLLFIGCALGKEKVHGDLFKDMRLYFDEQRLPPTNDGNGTEPEAMRPAN